MIGNIWIIGRKTGLCLIHKNYGKLKKVDANLFSGLLSAIINFSEEVTGGDYIKSVAMGRNKFFYRVTTNFIIAISMEERFNEYDAKPILNHVLNSFIKLGYSEKALSGSDMVYLEPFEKQIDLIVQDAINILTIRHNYGDLLSEQYQVDQKVETAEIRIKKEKIEEAIENAEWALASGLYKDCIIYFHVAEELFKELEEYDMAQWCQEMVEQAKKCEAEENQDDQELPPFPVREAVLLDETKNSQELPPFPVRENGPKNEIKISSAHPSPPIEETSHEDITITPETPSIPVKETSQDIQESTEIVQDFYSKFQPSEIPEKTTPPAQPIKQAKPEKPAKPIKRVKQRLFQKIPYLLKPLIKGKKFPMLDLKVLNLCNGSHSIQDICNTTKISRIKVSEILRKYHKKKLIGIKRSVK